MTPPPLRVGRAYFALQLLVLVPAALVALGTPAWWTLFFVLPLESAGARFALLMLGSYGAAVLLGLVLWFSALAWAEAAGRHAAMRAVDMPTDATALRTRRIMALVRDVAPAPVPAPPTPVTVLVARD
jgi:hypothetical protein